MQKAMFLKRIVGMILCVAMIAGYIPVLTDAAAIDVNPGAVVADPGTAYTWESMLGTAVDGNRYAGRVWADKSVYKDGDTAILATGNNGSSFTVDLAEDENFQVVFSVLGSSMTVKETALVNGPMDVVLVLDTSASMDNKDKQGVTRLQRTIEASNKLLKDLLTVEDVRIAIVTYNLNSETVLPLAEYTNGITLKANNVRAVYAYDANDKLLGNDSGYTYGTNLQSGIDRGFNLLANASDVAGRVPVAIVLTDGQANRASQEGFYEIIATNKNGSDASGRNLYLSTLLNAAYSKTKIEEHYGKEATVYTVGVDIANNDTAKLLMDPAKYFNSSNTNNEVKQAYANFEKWAKGQEVTYNGWKFDHNYSKQNGKITDAKIAANINYADTYYDVSDATVTDAFQQISKELTSTAFNPISTSNSSQSGNDVDDTPLIYVDYIGQYMEIKEIQAITLFGASYSVADNGNGTYTVAEATGTNPTTNEAWNTAEDIKISVTEDSGVQKLEIRINQEILPIIMDQVVSQTTGNTTSATLTEVLQNPLRVFYTVGVDSDIVLPNGEIDASKIAGYANIDETNGTATFYSNQFGVENPAVGGVVTNGDAHIGFQPSDENRYYYHQSNQRIFTKITDKQTGATVTIPANNQYGIVWDNSQYNLVDMTYDEYKNAKDSDIVYTYVNFYRPTPSTADAANAAEKVSYLVYTEWQYLKESVAFYDATAQKYLNDGKAIPVADVEATIAVYKQSNPRAELYAVLGTESLRTSRLHNMIVAKEDNTTKTAANRYAPEYTYERAGSHNENDVIIWLGNNGKLTVDINTGIALTKRVTEAIGDVNDTYALTVTVPAGVAANPVVKDANGNTVISTYENNVLTVNVKAEQTVYITGIPAGTTCQIGEIISGDYHVASMTASAVTVPTLDQVQSASNPAAQFVPVTVTNAPNQYGNLVITKEIESDHEVPASILDTTFEITVNVGTALAGKTFTVNYAAGSEEKTVDANGNLVFMLKAGEPVEISRLPVGTNVTVTESNPGSHFTVSYRTKNRSDETADSDNVVTIPENGGAIAVVLNNYAPTATSVDLDVVVKKDFADQSVASLLMGAQFEFAVQKYEHENQRWVDIATKSIAYGANEYGEKSATIDSVLNGESYTKAGTYSYRVLEKQGDDANISYDRFIYNFNVVITDIGGQLKATVVDEGNNEEVTNTIGDEALDFIAEFRNTYDTAPISMDIQKVVVNKSGDTTVSANGFAFKFVEVDANGNTGAVNTIYSDVQGVARISGVYTRSQLGNNYYIVYEENTAKPGWTYSGAQYFVTVEVKENGDGNIYAEMTIAPYNEAAENETAPTVADNNKGKIYFTNTYDPEDITVNLDGQVKKELSGKQLEANQFTFYVYKDGDRTTKLLEGKNDLNGNVSFVDFDGVLTFAGVGEYEYDVVEGIPEGAQYDAVTGKYKLNGMYYDPTIYDLVVEVENDKATGKLVANWYFKDVASNTVTFQNLYKATPTSYTLGGTKVLTGRALHKDEFTFELYEGDNLIAKATNLANGTFTFAPVEYTEPGEYVYTIREAQGVSPGVTYTGVNTPVTVTVTVTDTNGVLSATASMENADIKFVNEYKAEAAAVKFLGTKVLVGATLEDNTFTFNLYQTDNSFDMTKDTAVLEATDSNEDGQFDFVKTFNTTGTYYFVVTEDASAPIADVVYDRTQHKFAVQVTDNGNGQLHVSVTNVVTGDSSAPGPWNEAHVGFTNADFDEVTEKTVFKADTTTQIDGERVNAGDILTYYIQYTNYTGEDVVVDIMDTIPEHTAYVEGSASHSGTYVGTHVNWVLDVKRGESVKVSFQVKVTETESIVANIATVRDGVNTYKTNEVFNHTVEDNAKKDVFYADNDTVSIDGKKVYAGDELLYKITFTNSSVDVVNVQITDVIPANTTYVVDSADNNGVYADGKITWNIENMPAMSTVTVSFKVKVNNEGNVTIKNAAEVKDGKNTYTTNEVSNYTVADEVAKDVFFADNTNVSVDGKRVYAGDILVYAITYKNTARESATVTITDSIPAHTTYVAGSADGNGVYSNGVITWVENVAPGATVTVSFKVKVNDEDNVTIKNVAEVKDGKNSYTTNEVSNYTVEDVVGKEVFSDSDKTTNIDGKNVIEGDVLMYAISFKNNGKEKATVTITDTIPEHTTYVDGSADNGGVYKDGKITWTLDVEPGATVNVTFKVKVAELGNADDVKLSNQAEIKSGRNSYTTNAVTNPVKPVPTKPQTGDSAQMWLWFTLLLVSGVAFLVTVFYPKRRYVGKYCR